MQVVSKRVQNAKSERFYKSSLGKKKTPGVWQVGSETSGAHTRPPEPTAAQLC